MDKAMELVEQLATKLGVAAEYLWAVLVKQQYVDGIADIILVVFGIAVMIVLIIGAPKLTAKYLNEYTQLRDDRLKNRGYSFSSIEEDHCKEMYEIIPYLAFTIGLCVFIFTLCFVVSGVKQVINPEYYALKEVLDTISAG